MNIRYIRIRFFHLLILIIGIGQSGLHPATLVSAINEVSAGIKHVDMVVVLGNGRSSFPAYNKSEWV